MSDVIRIELKVNIQSYRVYDQPIAHIFKMFSEERDKDQLQSRVQ